MSETIQSWLDRAAAHPAVLACGVRRVDHPIQIRSCREELSETVLTHALHDLVQAVQAMQQNRLPTERLRWSFENGRIHCVGRPGGLVGALLLNPQAADSPEIENLLASFPAS